MKRLLHPGRARRQATPWLVNNVFPVRIDMSSNTVQSGLEYLLGTCAAGTPNPLQLVDIFLPH
jgi:hypothetical protein